MTDTPQSPEEDDALAAEYVLRLLDAETERAFERRLLADTALRERVRMWEAEFAPLAEDVPDVTPPPRVKTGVMAAIADAPARKPFGFWKWAVPSVLAFAAIGFLVFGPLLRGPQFDPTLHVSLASLDGSLQIEAGYSPGNNLFKVLRPEGDPRPGRVLEIWIIGEGSDTPVSLGVLPEERETLFELDPALVPLIDGGVMAVSDEPPGGSPTGSPTGEILATGAFFDI